ncbi:MAG TPA: protein kinase [Terriglobales bacterium]|nr:protein kinase [Terriglobales bacterium]
MAMTPGAKFGPYEILSPLGAGGMGQVFRARDERLKRDVAIKFLSPKLALDAEALRRLEQEARAIAALNHPNLLTIHDVGAAPDGAPFLVCELLEGESLRARLATGALPVRQALVYAAQLAHGLAAAHAKGIIHRDLKPENIFCTGDGRVKILDFGLAKFSPAALGDDRTLPAGGETAAGVVLGTVSYMSPEQARGQAADARSDVFSLGAVIYEMLSGRRAFGRDTAADTISAILREEPAELELANSALAAPIERILRHCLEKQPARRFQAAEDLAFALEGVNEAHSTTSLQAAAPAGPNRRRWLFAAVGTLGLIAAAAAGWMWAGARTLSAVHFQRLTYTEVTLDQARFLSDGRTVLGISIDGSQPPDSRFAAFTARLDSPGSQPFDARFDRLLAVAAGQAAVLLHLAILRAYERVGTLALMPLSGGAPRPLLENVEFADFAPGGDDASKLAIARYHPDTDECTLEYPVGHVLFRTNGWIGNPRFARDGKSIAFLDHPMKGDDNGQVAVVDLDGHERILGPHFGATQGLAWSPAGDEIWYAASSGIRNQLYAASLRGRNRLLLDAPANLHLEDVLPNGQVLVRAEDVREAMMVVTPDHPQPRDFSVLDWPDTAAMSADGKQFLIDDQDAGTNYATYLRDASGSPPIRLGDGDPWDLSPDGQWALSALPGSTVQLELLPTGAGAPRQLTHANISWERAAFLPDSRGIVATGVEPGHAVRAYLLDGNGNAKALTPEGVIAYFSNLAGTAILTRGPHGLAFYPIAGGAPTPVLPAFDWTHVRPLRFMDDTTLLAQHILPNGDIQVLSVNLRTGAQQLRTTVSLDGRPASGGLGLWGISRDGRSYVYKYGYNAGTLYVVTGLR